MRTLKNQPLQRWYRIKDGIVYNILTTQPSKEMLQDYKSTSELIDYLPYIKITYGYLNSNGETETTVEEKLYLDCLIESGDKLITNGNNTFFEPYINNSEDTISKGYYTILCSEFEDEFCKLIIKGTDKAKIINLIPNYLKYTNVTYPIPEKTINQTIVNSIIQIEVVNCFLYDADSQSYQEQQPYGYVEKYDEFACKVIGEYYKEVISSLCEKQDIINPTINVQITPDYQRTDNYFTVIYDINNITSPSRILGSLFDVNQLYCMEIDGVRIKPANKYTFNSKGAQQVTFYVTNDSSSLVNLAHLLDCCEDVSIVNFSHLNTRNVKDMSRMLAYNINLSKIIFNESKAKAFTTKNVTNMASMFEGCKTIKTISLDGFETSSVRDMSYMFSQCNSLVNIDTTILKTYNVTNMKYMFHKCEKLQSIDCSNFNTAKVTTMESMFNGCSNIKELSLNFQTSLVESMAYMFYGCSSLQSIVLDFNSLIKLKSMSSMFEDCVNLNSYQFNFPSNKKIVELPLLTTTEKMFRNCSSLTSMNLTPWNLQSITNMSKMFEGCSSLHGVGMWVYGKKPMELDATDIFNGCPRQGVYWYQVYTAVNEYKYTYEDFVWDTKVKTRLVTDEALQKEAEKYITEPEEPEVVGDYILATYNVTNTGNTQILGITDNLPSLFDKMIINGVEMVPAKTHTFTTTGEVEVQWVLKDGYTSFYQLFEECYPLMKLDFSNCDMSNIEDMTSMLLGCEGVSSVTFKGDMNPDAICDDMFGASMNGTLIIDKEYEANYAKVIEWANGNGWNINSI